MAKNNTSEAENINIIAAGTEIVGDLKTAGVIRLNGILRGNLETTARLVIGRQGKVEGKIKCKNADIEGRIEGTIEVQELLSLKSTANIQGDIITKQLSVEPNAMFTGTCKMPNENNAPNKK